MTDNPPDELATFGKEMPGEKAIEMAEVALIHNDLNTCTRLMRTVRQRYLAEPLSDEDRDIKLALFRDAVNLYVSAFVGSGYKLDKAKIYADAGALAFFQWALDLRNSYAAHTFGAARQCVTQVMPDPKTGKALGVGPLRMDLDFVNGDSTEMLGKASEIAAKYCTLLGQSLNDELLAEAVTMTTEEIAALPNAHMHVPANDELTMGRHAFRRIKTGQAKPPKRRGWRKQRDLGRQAGKSETPSDPRLD
jgi:hypothetical protein